MQYSSNEK